MCLYIERQILISGKNNYSHYFADLIENISYNNHTHIHPNTPIVHPTRIDLFLRTSIKYCSDAKDSFIYHSAFEYKKMAIWPTHNCGIDSVLCLLFTKYAKQIFSIHIIHKYKHALTHLIYIE